MYTSQTSSHLFRFFLRPARAGEETEFNSVLEEEELPRHFSSSASRRETLGLSKKNSAQNWAVLLVSSPLRMTSYIWATLLD